MGTATLDGIPFRVDPSSISWAYKIKIGTTKTIGGKVIQILGTTFGDLVLSGQMGNEGHYLDFFKQVLAIADSQVPTKTNQAPLPVRFIWPSRGWDFSVYVKSMVQLGAQTAVQSKVDTVAPKYSLVMFVAEDNGNIIKQAKESAETQFLNRLTKGMGWQQSAWNGPQSDADMARTLAGGSVQDYLFAAYGQPQSRDVNAGGQ